MPPSQVLVISNSSLHNGRLTSDQTSQYSTLTIYCGHFLLIVLWNQASICNSPRYPMANMAQ